MDKTLSKTISALRFPLIVAIVMNHATLDAVVLAGENIINSADAPVYSFLAKLISDTMALIAVPLFCAFSGYLFFASANKYDTSFFIEKYRKRARSLLIPYLFWNILVLLLVFLTEIIFGGVTSGRNLPVVDYSFIDYCNALWNRGQTGKPICFQMWFIRDLMVVVLFSPLICLCLRYFKVFFLLIMGSLWVLDFWFDVNGLAIRPLFFFSLGAYCAIYKVNFAPHTVHLALVALPAYVVALIFEMNNYLPKATPYIHTIGILLGATALFAIMYTIVQKNDVKTNQFFPKCSFFIFAYHAIFLRLAINIYAKMVQPTSDCDLVLMYFVNPIIIVFIGLLAYYMLKKITPKFTALITGGR